MSMDLQTIGTLVFVFANFTFVGITKYFGFKIAFTNDNTGIAINAPIMFGFLRTIFCLASLYFCLEIFKLENDSLKICFGFVVLWTVASICFTIFSVQKLLGKRKTKTKSKILELLSK